LNKIKTFKITIDNQGLRLDKFLAKNALNFSLTQRLIRKKLVKIDGQIVPASYKLRINDVVEIPASLTINKSDKSKKNKIINPKIINQIESSIIYKDDNLLAIDKPSGLAVQSGSGINFSIDDALPHLKFEKQEVPRLVHRLDKDTSGILLIARNRKSADLLTAAFKTKQIQKIYLAIVKGVPSKKQGVINIPIIKKYQGKNEKVYKDESSGKEAITNYKLLRTYDNINCSLLELQPITGRTHQLRVHCKEIGHPIIGDGKYGDRNNASYNMEKRLHLHAFKIVIEDFFGKKLVIETKQPSFVS